MVGRDNGLHEVSAGRRWLMRKVFDADKHVSAPVDEKR